MGNSIEIKGLRTEFGSKVAVRDLTLSVREGSLYALLGVNGAGKTTTIRMLTGLTKSTAGEAYVMGHSIATELEEVKKLVNISPQETSVAPNLTVRENLEFIAGIYGFDKAKAREKVAQIIAQFSMEEVE